MKEKLKKGIGELAERASSKTVGSLEALQFSQAAANLANALCAVKAEEASA